LPRWLLDIAFPFCHQEKVTRNILIWLGVKMDELRLTFEPSTAVA